MKSMTGYGKGEAVGENRKIVIELKSVNNRYLDINSRVSKAFSFADEIIKKIIQEKVKRGSVEVFYSYTVTGNSGKTACVDLSLAGEYIAAAKKLAESYSLENDMIVSKLMRAPDVVTVTSSDDNREEIEGLIRTATKNAVLELNKMREVEGKSIEKDLTKLVGNISSALENVKLRAPQIVSEYKEKLQKRIKELCADVSVDDARLAAEVAFFADRSDINEEISRLSSHIGQFLSVLASSGAEGRRLDFLSQEMNREINTMGSKANDLTLTNLVIGMKNELEKIKEQIRNVE